MSSGAVVRVLEADERRARQVGIERTERARKAGGVHHRPFAADGPDLHSRERGCTGHFTLDDVRIQVGVDLGPGVAENDDGALIGHRPAGEEQRSILSRAVRHQLFELRVVGSPSR